MAAKGYIYKYLMKINLKKILILFIIGFLLALMEVKYHYIMNQQDGNYIAITSILYEIIAILLFWKIKDKIKNNLFIFLGIYSFGIFLLHKPILDLFKYFSNININLFYGIVSIGLSIIILKMIKLIKGSIYAS